MRGSIGDGLDDVYGMISGLFHSMSALARCYTPRIRSVKDEVDIRLWANLDQNVTLET